MQLGLCVNLRTYVRSINCQRRKVYSGRCRTSAKTTERSREWAGHWAEKERELGTEQTDSSDRTALMSYYLQDVKQIYHSAFLTLWRKSLSSLSVTRYEYSFSHFARYCSRVSRLETRGEATKWQRNPPSDCMFDGQRLKCQSLNLSI